jgi:hypothetical protein
LVLLDGITPKLAPGVIDVSAKKTVSADKMKKQLIDMAKKKGHEYAYIVRKIGSSAPMPDDVEAITASIMAMFSGKKPTEKPTYIYRVSVKDGSETLVRTVALSAINIDSFKEVLAVSDNKQAWNLTIANKNGISGLLSQAGMGVVASFIVPNGILLPAIEVQKNQSVALQKQPITPNPLKE